MITIKDFQKYVINMLEGVPEYNLQNAKTYFTRYYKQFLEYYREHLFALEQVKRANDRVSFFYYMQWYLVNSAKTISNFISSGVSKMSEVIHSDPRYLSKAIQLFSDALSNIDNKIAESSIGRAADLGLSSEEFFEEMFSKYGAKEEGDLLINELAIIQKEIIVFGNTNFEKLAIDQINNELIKSI